MGACFDKNIHITEVKHALGAIKNCCYVMCLGNLVLRGKLAYKKPGTQTCMPGCVINAQRPKKYLATSVTIRDDSPKSIAFSPLRSRKAVSTCVPYTSGSSRLDMNLMMSKLVSIKLLINAGWYHHRSSTKPILTNTFTNPLTTFIGISS